MSSVLLHKAAITNTVAFLCSEKPKYVQKQLEAGRGISVTTFVRTLWATTSQKIASKEYFIPLTTLFVMNDFMLQINN